MTFRERLAIRLLGLVSFVLPADHRALLSFLNLAAEIEQPEERPTPKQPSPERALNWWQADATTQTAMHGDWRFTVERRRAPYSLGSGCVYEYAASAHEYGTALHDLGTHTDSNIARQKCADFINSKTTEGVTT